MTYEELQERRERHEIETIRHDGYLQGVDAAIAFLKFNGHNDIAEDMIIHLYNRKLRNGEKLFSPLPKPFHVSKTNPRTYYYDIFNAASVIEKIMGYILGSTRYFVMDASLRPTEIDGTMFDIWTRHEGFGVIPLLITAPVEYIERMLIDCEGGGKHPWVFHLGINTAPCCDDEGEQELLEEHAELVEEWEQQMKEEVSE